MDNPTAPAQRPEKRGPGPGVWRWKPWLPGNPPRAIEPVPPGQRTDDPVTMYRPPPPGRPAREPLAARSRWQGAPASRARGPGREPVGVPWMRSCGTCLSLTATSRRRDPDRRPQGTGRPGPSGPRRGWPRNSWMGSRAAFLGATERAQPASGAFSRPAGPRLAEMDGKVLQDRQLVEGAATRAHPSWLLGSRHPSQARSELCGSGSCLARSWARHHQVLGLPSPAKPLGGGPGPEPPPERIATLS